MSTHRFTNLRSVTDDVHALFDAWADSGRLSSALDEDGEIVLRLAVHEWIANIVQHAYFRDATPEIRLSVEVAGDAAQVVLEDNSAGFDLMRQVEQQQAILDAPAPSERGRGLLMLITCTQNLDYRPARQGLQRLSFSVRNPDSSVFEGLFRPEDLFAEGDGLFGDSVPDLPPLPAAPPSGGDGAAGPEAPFSPHPDPSAR